MVKYFKPNHETEFGHLVVTPKIIAVYLKLLPVIDYWVLQNKFDNNIVNDKIIFNSASLTMGVFLCHWFIFEFFKCYKINNLTKPK